MTALDATIDPLMATDPAEKEFCTKCGHWHVPLKKTREEHHPPAVALEDDPEYWLDMALAARQNQIKGHRINRGFREAANHLERLGKILGFRIAWE